MLFCDALLQGFWERCLCSTFPFFVRDAAMNLEQLRRAVEQQQTVVERLQAELNKADQELIKLEIELEKAEAQVPWFNLYSALRRKH